ncbi:dnaJ homolog subfamily C member 12-like [Gigantopelta aegis]|uniref:dnaJ homolog subfamily C member 12-like n=1 Tax=Gigantopelta aegis TaxID=1735272 RepID=UPI001B88AA99|nr:dnaJ homolog subfamily C member 12-like [Gigantopelta aegis]
MDKIFNYKRKQEDDYYYIIGCDELSNESQILAEYKARVLSCHPDKHPNDPDAAEQFTKLQKVKEVLTDPKKRAHYDKWRTSGIAMPYDDWCSLRDSVHVSMHWGTVKTNPMLSDAESSVSSQSHTEHEHITTVNESDTDSNKDTSHRVDSVQQPEEIARPAHQVHCPNWERDCRSGLLQKFRNYDI